MKTSSMWTTTVLALAVAGLLAGCARPLPPAVGKEPMPAGTYPSIVALEGLNNYIVADTPVVEHSTPERAMRVTVPIRTTARQGHNIQYRFEFLDRDGRPLKQAPSWRFLALEPNVQAFVEGMALDPAAADWRLQLRPAR